MFTDLSYFDPQQWLWDFGDGSTSAESHPVHSFEEKGLYHVCLTVSNDNSADSTCKWIEVDMTTSTDDELSTLSEVEMQVFPNPFTERIRITYGPDHQMGRYSVRLIDAYGRVIHDQEIMVPAAIHLERLPEGMYACVLLDDQGRVLDSEIIVKQ